MVEMPAWLYERTVRPSGPTALLEAALDAIMISGAEMSAGSMFTANRRQT